MPQCSVCGRVAHDHELYRTNEGRICGSCFSERGYIHCNCCNEYFIPDEPFIRVCPNCENRVYERDINSYSTKPRPYFKNFNSELDGKDIGVRYYGMELEFNNSSPSEVFRLGGELYKEKFIYNKSDSSISNGVEIVTSPLERRVIPQLLKRMKPIFDYMDERRYKDNAGLHIHVNKKTIDAIDRYKLNILLNTCSSEKEKDIMYMLSGRKEKYSDIINVGYCQIGSKKDIIRRTTGHHVALNMANEYTFEFRIFKSTNNPDRIMSYIELVDSMIDFCHTRGIKDINIGNFIVYLKQTSTNDILLNIIKDFESNSGKFIYSQRIISFGGYAHKLDGLRWYEFYKLLPYVNDVNSISEYCKSIDIFIDDYKNGKLKLNTKWLYSRSSYDKVEKLKDTIRKVLIHRIKEGKDKRKCA